MFGCVGLENPVVIDSLWDWEYCRDAGRDVEEPEIVTVNIDVDTHYLTDSEVNDLINRLESVSWESEDVCSCGNGYFKVDYDLDANRTEDGDEAPIVLIELRGECEEKIYDKLIDTIENAGADYSKK